MAAGGDDGNENRNIGLHLNAWIQLNGRTCIYVNAKWFAKCCSNYARSVTHIQSILISLAFCFNPPTTSLFLNSPRSRPLSSCTLFTSSTSASTLPP